MPTSNEMYRRLTQVNNALNGLLDEAGRNPAGIVVIARHELEGLTRQAEELHTIMENEIHRELLLAECTTTNACTHKKQL
jgi:hypothetical protein